MNGWTYFDDPNIVGKILTNRFWINFWSGGLATPSPHFKVKTDFGATFLIPIKWVPVIQISSLNMIFKSAFQNLINDTSVIQIGWMVTKILYFIKKIPFCQLSFMVKLNLSLLFTLILSPFRKKQYLLKYCKKKLAKKVFRKFLPKKIPKV